MPGIDWAAWQREGLSRSHLGAGGCCSRDRIENAWTVSPFHRTDSELDRHRTSGGFDSIYISRCSIRGLLPDYLYLFQNHTSGCGFYFLVYGSKWRWTIERKMMMMINNSSHPSKKTKKQSNNLEKMMKMTCKVDLIEDNMFNIDRNTTKKRMHQMWQGPWWE